jgi:DNA replication protein DnaC
MEFKQREDNRTARGNMIRDSERIARDRIYTCEICSKDVSYKVAYDQAYFDSPDGTWNIPILKMAAFNSHPLIENGDVVFNAKVPFVTCSNECRIKWLHKYWYTSGILRDCVTKWCVPIPSKLTLVINFDDFKNDRTDAAGVSNRTKMEYLEQKLDGNKGFYLYGDSGCGKSTLAAWLARYYVVEECAVTWITYNDLQEALDSKNANAALAAFVYQNVREEYGKVVSKGKAWDVVVIDDISNDFAPGSDQQKRLKRLFSQWYDEDCRLILTSNVDIKTLSTAISPMVESRLTETVIECGLPKIDYRKN